MACPAARGVDDVLLIAGGAFVGLATCMIVSDACFGLPAMDRGRADPGTPRAGFCAPVDHWWRWIVLPLVAIVLSYGLSRLMRRVPYRRLIALALVVVVAVAYVVVAHNLVYYIPV